jgi:hypothetical protein
MQPNPVDQAVAGTALGTGAAWLIAIAALLAIGFLLFYWRRSRARGLAQRLQRPDADTRPAAVGSGRTP